MEVMLLGDVVEQGSLFDESYTYVADGKTGVFTLGEAKTAGISTVSDLVDGTTAGRFHVKSAFHKEVRRRDYVRGMTYARWFRRIHGDAALRAYIVGIIFEETRNVELLRRALNKEKGIDLASMILRSRMKHELKFHEGSYVRHLDVLSEAQAMDSCDYAKAVSSRDYEQMSKAQWFTELVSDDAKKAEERSKLWGILKSTGGVCDDSAFLSTLDWRRTNDWYSPKTMIEIMSGIWDSEEANYIEPLENMPSIDWSANTIYAYRSYVHDNHTRSGLIKVSRNLRKIKPNERQPSGIDLRFSGMERGTVWRDCAGGNIHREWEDVYIPSSVWRLACQSDATCYKWAGGAW